MERAVQAGDEDVKSIYHDVLQVWVILLMNIILLINPEHLIVGGAITPKNVLTIDTINAMLKKALFIELKVKVSEVGENAVLTGGLYELKRYVLNNEIVKAAVGDLE
ncbi:MAG: ROK family protein [Clostridia bacterium]|nr:ROK family protein [Clostridia bacterium]